MVVKLKIFIKNNHNCMVRSGFYLKLEMSSILIQLKDLSSSRLVHRWRIADIAKWNIYKCKFSHAVP